jgi:hypothetical protein
MIQRIPEGYRSLLFEQRTAKNLISACHLIDEGSQTFQEIIGSGKPGNWFPPYRPLCFRCFTYEANAGRFCALCEMVNQKGKELFDLQEEGTKPIPNLAICIHHPNADGIDLPPDGFCFSCEKEYLFLMCGKNNLYDFLFNYQWNGASLVVVELNKSVEHIGNPLQMAQHHATHIQPSESTRVKFIFADLQIYSSDVVYDMSMVQSLDDLQHIISGVETIRLNFDYEYLDQLIAYFHKDDIEGEYHKNKILQICSKNQKRLLFELNLFDMPKNFALLLLRLARLFNAGD